MAGIPYTTADPLDMTITLHKPTTKKLLMYHGLPIPSFQEFVLGNEPLRADLTFPLFCKPEHEGTGMELGLESGVSNEDTLRRRIRYILEAYQQPALVEPFVDGRELTVGIIDNLRNPALPVQHDPVDTDLGLHVFPMR